MPDDLNQFMDAFTRSARAQQAVNALGAGPPVLAEIDRLRAENAALRKVGDAVLQALIDLKILSLSPVPDSYTEAVDRIFLCLVPIAEAMEGVMT